MTEPLFPDYPETHPKPPPTPAERRRARQQLMIDSGIHPLTKLRLANNGHKCKDCAHRILIGGHSRDYPKCDLTSMSHSEASDCRAWWPACTSWEPRP